MKRLLFLLLLGIAFTFGYLFPKTPQVIAKPVEVQKPVQLNEQILWSLIQNFRLENNRRPYIKNQVLCEIATKRSGEIDEVFEHTIFHERYKNYPSVLGENIAKTNMNELAVYNGWLNSLPHRAALEKQYTYSCIATKDQFAVQIFSNCENGCPVVQ